MGTNLYVAIGHSLDTIQISNLPTSLNQYFADHIDKIQMRISHGYSGNLLNRDNNDWVWELVDELDWDAPHELEGENFWTWIDKPKPTESFEQYLQENGYLYINGPYCMSMFIGRRVAILSTDVHWDHFLFDEIVQTDMRCFSHFLMKFFGSYIAVYMPDDISPTGDAVHNCLHQEWDLDQMLSWLKSQKPPAQSIQTMIKTVSYQMTACWKAEGYYVDDFAKFIAWLG
ncbi:hypothetical protein [Nostoc sp.]|uniref:hypothetical protein n=1 Tax=Nostoc sp. TaxID=1180 RepID=UPI002FFA2044